MTLKSRALYKLLFDNKYVRTFFRAVPGHAGVDDARQGLVAHDRDARRRELAATTSSSSTRRRPATGSTCCACRR